MATIHCDKCKTTDQTPKPAQLPAGWGRVTVVKQMSNGRRVISLIRCPQCCDEMIRGPEGIAEIEKEEKPEPEVSDV